MGCMAVLEWMPVFADKEGCQVKMMFMTAAAVSLAAAPLLAQTGDLSTATPAELYQIAVESGVCEDRAVQSAAFNPIEDRVEVVCEEEAAGVVPLLGGLGGGGLALAGAGLALALGAGGSSSSSDTQ